MREATIVLALLCLLSASASALTMPVSDVSKEIRISSYKVGIDPEFMVAIGQVESGLRTDAVGSYGERGPLQVLPRTFYLFGGRDINNWRETTAIGVSYFAYCLERANGNYVLASVYYNAGVGNTPYRSRRYAGEVSRRFTRNLLRQQLPDWVINPKGAENWDEGFQLWTLGLAHASQFKIANGVLGYPRHSSKVFSGVPLLLSLHHYPKTNSLR